MSTKTWKMAAKMALQDLQPMLCKTTTTTTYCEYVCARACLFSSRRNRLLINRRDNTQSKHSPDVAVTADWTHSMSPSYNSSLVLSQHQLHCMSPSYLTLQYQPQRRRRKLSEPDYSGTRTAFVDLRRSLHVSQSQTNAGESHADVTGVRYCMTSCGNTDFDWREA